MVGETVAAVRWIEAYIAEKAEKILNVSNSENIFVLLKDIEVAEDAIKDVLQTAKKVRSR